MTLIEAYSILEIDPYVNETILKENYRWLVKFYHPDNMISGDTFEFQKIIKAYNIIKLDRLNGNQISK